MVPSVARAVPPETGAYTFYIAGDAPAQLFLSNDTGSADEQLIASVPAATGPEQWMQSAAQRSVSIILNAGSSYYIEAISNVWLVWPVVSFDGFIGTR